MGSRSAISKENRASEIGAIETWAYHCYRCNYTWLPKDYVVNHSNRKRVLLGEELLDREPPKACARCKSKSWKNIISNRRPKENHVLNVLNEGFPFLTEKENKGWFDDLRYNYPWVTNRARMRALIRQDKTTLRDILQFIGSKN